MLADTLRTMRADGVRRAIAFVTSPYGGYSACRQYWDDIARARAEVGDGAPEVDKIRHYHDHPGFVEPFADAVRAAWTPGARLVFTAHSIPLAMEVHSGPDGHRYTAQLNEAASLVAGAVGVDEWDLVWQSRSGPPSVPWLEPDVNDHLEALAKAGATAVVAAPIGFISDHLEVIWDLDNEAAATAVGAWNRLAAGSYAGNRPAVRGDGGRTGRRADGRRAPAKTRVNCRCGTRARWTGHLWVAAQSRGVRTGSQEGWGMGERKAVESWLTDMDGVLVHEGNPDPGAPEFIGRLRQSGKPFLVLTNNSIYTPRDLCARLARLGHRHPRILDLDLGARHRAVPGRAAPAGTAYVIGEAGLTTALHEIDYVLTDHDPTTWCSARRGRTRSRPSPRRSGSSTTAPGSSPPTPT
jgi:hypothetical protein